MQNLWSDLRYALRMLHKGRSVTVTAVLALALGIGGSSAMFTVVNDVLLEPLPFTGADRLVLFWEKHRQIGRFSISPPNFVDYRQQNQVFEDLTALTRESFNLTGSEEPERISGLAVSAGFFQVLRVEPLLGRAFTDDEDRPGGDPVVILSHGLWQRRFGADPEILGKTVRLDDQQRTVVGVMPPVLRFPSNVDLWVPLALDVAETNRGGHYLAAIGRLKPGITLEAAQRSTDALAARLEAEYPDSNTHWRTLLDPLQEYLVEDVRLALLVLFAAVGFVLLIACANVANLLLARAAERDKEIAVRAALGAGRWRLLRQLLTESVVLGLSGGVLGLGLALWGVRAVLALSPERLPRLDSVGVDTTALVFTIAISVLTGLLFGLAPALSAAQTDLHEALKQGSGRSTSGRRRHRLRSLLVVSEVALALILLVGAGLLLRTLWHLQQVDPGLETENVLTARLSLSEHKYPEEGAERATYFQELMRRIRNLPGVESASLTHSAPLSTNTVLSFELEGAPPSPPGESPNANIRVVGSDYFRTLGIALRGGRAFTDQEAWHSELDIFDGPGSIVVNRAMVQRFWPGSDPVGKRLTFGDPGSGPWQTVVGVVADVRDQGLAADTQPEIFVPYAAWPMGTVTVVVRTAADPAQLSGPVRESIRRLDPNQPAYSIQTMEQMRLDSMAQERFNLILLGLFAAVALLLAAVGIFGVLASSVAERIREIGIRVTLGADRGEVMRLVFRQAVVLVVGGVAVGAVGAWGLARLMRSLIHGVSPSDPVTFVGVSVLLAGVALLATYVPARRAVRVDPMVVLRTE